MRALVAWCVASLPLLAAAQEAQVAPAQAADPAQVSAAPPQYAPVPQDAPSYAAPSPYAPPAPQAPAPCAPAAPAQLADRPERQRDGWYFGVALGGGDAQLRFRANPGDPWETLSTRELLGTKPTKVAMSVRAGTSLTRRLLLGADLSVFSASAIRHTEAGDAEGSLGIYTLSGVVTFFPTDGGLFFRGGLGVAHYLASSEAPGVPSRRDETDGYALSGGVGYALRVGRSAHVTAALDVSGQSYGGPEPTVPDASSYWAFRVGVDWY